MTKAFRVVEDSHAERLAVDHSVHVHPVGAFAPYLRFPFAALRIHHGSRGRIQFGSESKGESALLRVAKLDRSLTAANDKLTVDRSRVTIAAERELLNFFGKRFTVRPLKVERSANGTGSWAGSDFLNPAKHHSPES